MKAGFYKININPKTSVELWGFASRKDKSKGILSDLYAKALILEDEHERVILISLDIGGIDLHTSESIKTSIAKKINVRKENICISTTHTHSAPAIFPLRYAGKPDSHYIKEFKEKTIESVEQALKNMYSIKVGFGVGDLKIAVNRREKGIRSDINQKEGTIDSQVSFIRIDHVDNTPFIMLVNYAMHPVTLYADNLHISADYPGEACQFIEQELNCNAMFLQGACANINPKLIGNFEATKLMGRALGEEVVNVFSLIKTNYVNSLKISSQYLPLPFDAPPEKVELEEKIQNYNKRHESELTIWEKTDYEWAQDLYRFIQQKNKKLPNKIDVQLQLLQIGDMFVLFLPGEIFIETGLEIKHNFPKNKLVIAAYSNDCLIGYLPPVLLFKQGGYEVEQAYKYYGLFRFASTAEEHLVIQTNDLIKENLLQ